MAWWLCKEWERLVKDLGYYERKLDIIIYLLNSTDEEKVTDYLLDEYAKNYIEYERLYNEQEREYKTSSSSMDWI